MDLSIHFISDAAHTIATSFRDHFPQSLHLASFILLIVIIALIIKLRNLEPRVFRTRTE